MTLLTESSISRGVTYNDKSQVTSDIVTTQRSDGTYVASTNYYYNASEITTGVWQGVMSGGSYQGGVVTMSRTVTNKTVGGTTTPQPTTETKNSYTWWDSALQTQEIYNPNISLSTTNTSTFRYDDGGRLTSVYIQDGRPRTVSFVNDAYGQILQRDEADNSANGDPRELHYYFNGRKVGAISNDGTSDIDYLASIQFRVITPGTSGAFRDGTTVPKSYADFDQSYDPINGLNYEGTSSRYIVSAGETLESISLQVWGDASFWYMIGEANGLDSSDQLLAGMSLIIPNKVHNAHNNTETYKVYNPNEAIGDTSPTVPRPTKRNDCGAFGQIILLAIAVAVTIWAAPASPNFWQGALAGAVGSAASQTVGVATGLQDKFSFKGVAMAAIAGGVAAGLGAGGKIFDGGAFSGLNAPTWVQASLRGATGSLISQGVGVSTGLQSKFDWAGVAAAGLSAGVMKGIGLSGTSGMIVGGVAGGLAGAAARSLITGTNFGDNIIAVLPSVIGNIIGNLAAQQLAGDGPIDSRGENLNAELISGATEGLSFAALQQVDLTSSGAAPLTTATAGLAGNAAAAQAAVAVNQRQAAAKAQPVVSLANEAKFRGLSSLGHEGNATAEWGDEAYTITGKRMSWLDKAWYGITHPTSQIINPIGEWLDGVGDAIVGSPIYRHSIGPGTIYDRTIVQYFYSSLNMVANSPLSDPGMGMAIEQAGAGIDPRLAAPGAGIVALQRGVQGVNRFATLVRDSRIFRAAEGVGVRFEGTLYRAVPDGGNPLDISFSVNANGRYTAPGQGGLYFASGSRIVEAEFVNNGSTLAGRTLHAFPESTVNNLLDLSNPTTRRQLGISLEDITRTGGTSAWRYEVTQPLGAYAQRNGYSGIIAPSAQADGGVNLILFGSKGVR